MLFRLCTWHALAKLRVHSDHTLDTFETATRTLGSSMRAFLNTVCPMYVTKELPKETQQRQARQARAQGAAPGPEHESSKSKAPLTLFARIKRFTLDTYKYHRLADYVRAIRLFGTVDNYTSQSVRAVHCCPLSPALTPIHVCRGNKSIIAQRTCSRAPTRISTSHIKLPKKPADRPSFTS